MSEAIQIIVALGVLFNGMAALLGALQSYRNGKAIQQVHLATNSMKDALVASTDREAFARGVKSGESSSMNINHRAPIV